MMDLIVEMIVSYVAIWVPSLVAVIGLVGTILSAVNKTKSALKELKNEDSFKQLSVKLSKAIADNKQLKQQNDIIIDQLTKIKGYRQELNKHD